MGKLLNEIAINADPETIWNILANPVLLRNMDPTVRKIGFNFYTKRVLVQNGKLTCLTEKTGSKEAITDFEPGKLHIRAHGMLCSHPWLKTHVRVPEKKAGRPS